MKHSDKRPEKHLLRNAQRTIADCKDHCGTKTKVYKIIKKSSTANKKAPLNGALDHFEVILFACNFELYFGGITVAKVDSSFICT